MGGFTESNKNGHVGLGLEETLLMRLLTIYQLVSQILSNLIYQQFVILSFLFGLVRWALVGKSMEKIAMITSLSI